MKLIETDKSKEKGTMAKTVTQNSKHRVTSRNISNVGPDTGT